MTSLMTPKLRLFVVVLLQCYFQCSAFHIYTNRRIGHSNILGQRFRKETQSNHIHHPVQKANSKSTSSLFYNPIENESEEERTRRMNMVRKLQRMYYQGDHEGTLKPPEKDSFIMEDVPLWRTQWTELPGSQRVLNVHVPHYTNMFRKILNSNAKTKYFGHLYLPGGSENMDNPEYRLEDNTKATLTGVLMKISSYRELEDGRLMLVVQALERFRVVEAKRHHSPYSIATIEILPDCEIIEAHESSESDDEDNLIDEEDANKASAVAEAFQWHEYEFLSVTNCTMRKDISQLAVSPLANYNIQYKSTKSESTPKNMDIDYSVLLLEHKVWVHLDEMIQLLRSFVETDKDTKMPIPSQLLGLLPVNSIQPWPENFLLEEHAQKLEEEKAFVGTFSKSMFVRVDNHCVEYPSIRRAQRLSFVIWTLTESILASGDPDFSRQQILEVDSLEKRLDAAAKKLQLICMVLKQNS